MDFFGQAAPGLGIKFEKDLNTIQYLEILSKNEYNSIKDDKKELFNSRYKYTIFNKISKEMKKNLKIIIVLI